MRVPTMVISATGCHKAEPEPPANIKGTIPRMVVVHVIRIGRTLDKADS